jgi:Aminoglycoside-2''-adenylyltransferase
MEACSLKSEMTAKDAIELYKLFEQHGIKVWIDGGWGVDALLGHQTRKHDDLDVLYTIPMSRPCASSWKIAATGMCQVAAAGVAILSSVIIKAIESTSIRLRLISAAKILLVLPTVQNT